MKTTLQTVPETEYFLPGNRSCAGCALALACRYVFKALEGNAIMTVPASCLTVLGGMYPTTAFNVPCLNCVFPGVAAAATGISAGLRALGKTDTTVLAFAGDGGTFDIGIQGLSGAAERNEDILYICYDNEAYMNTGTQRSSSTPLGAITSTTPRWGKGQHSKDMPAILEAHGAPYIATACSSYPLDLYDKVRKARTIRGTRYIQISIPCPPGWGFPTKDVVNIGRLGVETGAIVLFEIENGKFTLTDRSKALAERNQPLKPLEEYVLPQRRFARLTPEQCNELQQRVATRWTAYLSRR